MPRDSSGNYTLPVENPVVDGTLITTDWANNTLDDIALQLNNVITRDGLLGMVAPFKFVDGTVGSPAMTFASEPSMGWYRSSVGQLSAAIGNVERFRITADGANVYGTLSTAGDITTPGVINAANIVVSGTPPWVPAGSAPSGLFSDGTIGAPSITFANEPTNGLYRPAASTLKVAMGGTDIFGINKGNSAANLYLINGVNVQSQPGWCGLSLASTAAVQLIMNNPQGQSSNLVGQHNGNTRWYMSLADSAPETGGNNGANFGLSRCNDAGAIIDTPMSINRATGVVTFNAPVTCNGNVNVGNTLTTANLVVTGTPPWSGGGGTAVKAGTTVTGSGGAVTVNFAAAMTNPIVVASSISTPGNIAWTTVTGVNTNGFSVLVTDNSSNGKVGVTVHWMAVEKNQ
jgi:hypothetical protein